MRYPVLLIAFLFAVITASAQDYNPLTPGVNRYFINSAGYLRGMRVDSVTTAGNDLIYHPFHSPRNYYQSLDNNGGSWLGKHVLASPDGTFLFDNIWQDTVVIRTQAILNENWIMYDDATSIHYLATMTSIDTMTVLGTLDSIKTITITAYDNLQILTSDPLNNVEIIVSKTHGFVQTVDMYTFPMHEPGVVYQSGFDYLLDKNPPTNIQNIIFRLIDFHVPTLLEIYDYEIGDAFGKKGWEVGFFDKEWIDTVMYKNIVNSNYIEYTIKTNKKLMGTMGWGYTSTINTVTVSNALAFAMNGMPEESGEWYYYYYFPMDTSQCFSSPAYKIVSNFIYTSSFGSCGLTDIYKQKIGREYYAECFSLDPGDSQSDWMVYSVKNNQPCGYLANPLHTVNTPSISNNTIVYPNPAGNQLFIKNDTKTLLNITIFNVYGQLVSLHKSSDATTIIPTSEFPPGLYNLRIVDEVAGSITNSPIIIQR